MAERSDRIRRVADLARHEEARAGQALHEWQQQHDVRVARLQQLHGYRQDYRERLSITVAEGMDSRRLRDYHLFLDRLNQAIDQQDAFVKVSSSSVDQCLDDWTRRHLRTRALQNAADKTQSREQCYLDRLEQRQADDETRPARTRPARTRPARTRPARTTDNS